MTLTDEQRHVLTMLLTFVFGALSGLPLGILIARDKDWKR